MPDRAIEASNFSREQSPPSRRHSIGSDRDHFPVETGFVAARLRALGQNGRLSQASRSSIENEQLEESPSGSMSQHKRAFSAKPKIRPVPQPQSPFERPGVSSQKQPYFSKDHPNYPANETEPYLVSSPPTTSQRSKHDRSEASEPTSDAWEAEKFRNPEVNFEGASDKDMTTQQRYEAQAHAPWTEKKGWRQAIRDNASARVVASRFPLSPSSSSPEASGHASFGRPATRQDSAAFPSRAYNESHEERRQRSSTSLADRQICNKTHSIKSSIGDEIASMIESAIEGRSNPGSVHREPTFRPFSRQFAPGRLSAELKSPASNARSSRSPERITANAASATDPITSAYKLSSPNPVVHQGSPRQSPQSKLHSGYDRLDGYQFYPEPSSLLDDFPPRPKTVPATPESRQTAPGSSSYEPSPPSNTPSRVQSHQEQSMPPPLLPQDPRFDVFLRERTEFSAAAPRGASPVRSKRSSPKQDHLQGKQNASIDPKQFSSPVGRSTPRTLAPTPHPSTPVEDGGQEVSGGLPGWRWWKLVGSDREADAQYNSEEALKRDDPTSKRPRTPASPDLKGRTSTRGEPQAPVTPIRNVKVVKKKPTTADIRRASRELEKEKDDGYGTDEGFDADTESVRLDGSIDGSVEEAREESAKKSADGGIRGRRERGNVMQVVIELEEDDSGRVWVEVTPSPKSRKRGRERKS